MRASSENPPHAGGCQQPDNLGQTPLARAAWDGHQEAVKTLLMREDLNPYKPDSSGETPFSHAKIY